MARKSKGKNRGHHREREHASPTPAAKTAPKLSPDRAVLALAFVGMLLTAYLSVVAWRGGGAAFCTAGSGCDVVQGSAWSRLFGIPIAAWGFALYALLAWTARRPATTRLRRWRGLWRLSLVGLAISLYLTLAGVLALEATCLWCLLSLATIAAIFALVAVAGAELRGHVAEIGHGHHVDPGLRHRHHHVGEAEAEFGDEMHLGTPVGDVLVDEIEAGDAEMDVAGRHFPRDLGGREKGDLHPVEAAETAAIVALAARPQHRQAGALEEGVGVLL